jgi:hypothetical protein
MDVTSWLTAVQQSALAAGVRDSQLLFLAVQALHLVAMALVFGTIVVVDLRLLGMASTTRPFDRVAADIMKWTWAAFALSAVTGALMFITNATVYVHNPYFRVKVVLLVMAGLNVVVFQLTAWRSVERWSSARVAPGLARAAALVSLVVWLAVIVAGRMIGFTEGGTASAQPTPADDTQFEDLLGLPAGNGEPEPSLPEKK